MENRQEIVQTVVENPELLNQIIDTEQARTIIHHRAEMSFHKGPLPSPQDVAQYAQQIPNFGERIMAYAEREQAARHHLANQTLSLNKLGLFFGIFALLIITIFCAWLAYLGFAKSAAWVMGAVLVTVVSTFVIGKRAEKKD